MKKTDKVFTLNEAYILVEKAEINTQTSMYKRVSEGDKCDGTNPWIMARILLCVCQSQEDEREVKVDTWWREGIAKEMVGSAEMRTTERWLE